MPAKRLLLLSIVSSCALLLVAAPAAAQSAGAPAFVPVVQQSTSEPTSVSAEQPPTPQQQPQLATGGGSHNGEVSFFIGGLVGGDLVSLLDDGFSLTSTLDNGRTYGGRVGYYSFPLGAEGSFAYSNSGLGLSADLDEVTVKVGARVMYLEANALLILIPGPVQPFLTAGGGLHSYEFLDLAGLGVTKWGWNFGGGLKFNIKRVSLRVDVRDHITLISAADLNIDEELAELLDVGEQTLHNAEISFGIGFRF